MRERITKKQKDDYILEVKAMSNNDLFEEAMSSVIPDTYDDCMTRWGQFCRDEAVKEFSKRLREMEFLSKDFDEKLLPIMF